MALTNSTWRKHSFKVGNEYTALEAIKGVPINFSLGLTYVLDSISYARANRPILKRLYFYEKTNEKRNRR